MFLWFCLISFIRCRRDGIVLQACTGFMGGTFRTHRSLAGKPVFSPNAYLVSLQLLDFLFLVSALRVFL